jgi:hypothetical protein
MQDLGYDTHNTLINQGSLAIFTALWFFKLPILLIIFIIGFRSSKAKRCFRRMAKNMFFGELLAILIDSSFEFLICSYLQLKKPFYTMDGEVIAVYFAYFCLFLILGVLLPCLVLIIFQPYERYHDAKFE